MGYIYLIRNLINGKPYIGKTELSVGCRWEQHQCHARNNYGNALLHKAIRKYGASSFSIETLVECDDPIRLCELEKKHIQEHGSFVPSGYNLTLGGEGMAGFVPSEETRAKMRSWVRTSEMKQKLSNTRKGRNFCTHGHEFTPENTYVRPDGKRKCIACSKTDDRIRKDQSKAKRRARGLQKPGRSTYRKPGVEGRISKVRSPQSHCSKGHELTSENTYVGPDGYRNCRTCKAAHSRNANAANKLARHERGLKKPGKKADSK